MDYTIENYIHFCDEFIIAEEGLKDIGKNIWSGIRTTISKIRKWFLNVLQNLNKFKHAVLDSVLNSDIVNVLKMSQPRTELNFKPIQMYYKLFSTLKKDNGKVNRFVVGEVYEHQGFSEEFDDLIKRSTFDTTRAIDTAKKSKEYKRIQKNTYSYDNVTEIPLNNIQTDISKCNNMIISMEKECAKIESISQNENQQQQSLSSKMRIFLRAVISYCTFKIGVIGRYLRYAKLSIKGKLSKKKIEVKTTHDLNYHIPKIKKSIDKDNYAILKNAIEKMKNAKSYEEYKPNYDILTKGLGIQNHVIKYIKCIDATCSIIIASVKDDGEELLTSNAKFYHSSDNPTLKQLIPFFKSKSNTTFYPTPRIYLHLNTPANRLGSSIQNSESKGDTQLYEVAQKIPKCNVDRELGKSAVFVTTDKPIKIKKIDYNTWKKLEEVKLGFE